MISEAIDSIVGVTEAKDKAQYDARAPKLIGKTADGRREIFEHKGEFVERDVTPSLRFHHVDTVVDLIAATTRWAGNGKVGVLWLNWYSATLVIDDSDRRDVVTLALVEGDTWKLIKEIAKKQFTQAELVRLLRTKLITAQGRLDLLASVRSIKFRNHVSGTSSIQHGNESMGNSIENEVSGAADLPESITVDTYVYANMGERDMSWPVHIDLEINAKEQKFALTPTGDELAIVSQAALESIRGRIEVALPDVSVFYGQP